MHEPDCAVMAAVESGALLRADTKVTGDCGDAMQISSRPAARPAAIAADGDAHYNFGSCSARNTLVYVNGTARGMRGCQPAATRARGAMQMIRALFAISLLSFASGALAADPIYKDLNRTFEERAPTWCRA